MSVVWLDNNVSEHVRQRNWRAPLNINRMWRGNKGLGPSSRNRKDQNSCRKQA